MITITVVTFKFKKHTRYCPVIPVYKIRKCIFGAELPCKRRVVCFRSVLRYLYSTCSQRIAIMKVCIEITSSLKAMCDADKMPGYSNFIFQSFIPAFSIKNFINDGFYFRKFIQVDNTSIKKALVFR